MGALGSDRVIMVMNTAYGVPELLPFDLRKRRVLGYAGWPGRPPSDARKPLAAELEGALRRTFQSAIKDRLLPSTKDRLVKDLEPYSGRKVGIWTSMPEREDWRGIQEGFVMDLANCFEQAGWECITLTDVQIRPQPVGIVLVAYDGNTPPSNPDFGPIVGALANAGIRFEHRRMPLQTGYTGGITTSDPVIYVGPVYSRAVRAA
jgi:hypothetical protein